MEQSVPTIGVKKPRWGEIARMRVSALASKWSHRRFLAYVLVPAFAVLGRGYQDLSRLSPSSIVIPFLGGPWSLEDLSVPRGPVEIACFLGPGLWVYNWSFFILDTAFCVTISGATIFGSHAILAKLPWRKALRLSDRQVGFEHF